MSPLISPELLCDKIDKVVVVDARTGKDAYAAFRTRHVKGARFVDLESELATPTDPATGGRHPLPDARAFAATLGVLGIDPSDEVVVYDADAGTNAAARFWWMLRALGHTAVRVLDGGLAEAVRVGVPLASGETAVVAKPPYPSAQYRLPTVDAETVAQRSSKPDWVVLDARSPSRFRGESEPIDPVAGHIPHARNLFHRDHLDERGRMRPEHEVRAQIEAALGDATNVITSCGSGVTACHTILAMVYAGFSMPSLYVGSWSEWCRSGRAREPA